MLSTVRPWLLLALLPACSRPTPVVGVPAEVVEPAPSVAGSYRFVVSTSHEISCSQSFETHGVSVTYDLIIDPSAKVTLKVEGNKSSTFGPNFGTYESSVAAQFDHRSTPFVEQWSGVAKTVGDTVSLDLVSGALHWKLACTQKQVDAKAPLVGGVDSKATTSVATLSCTPPRRLGDDDTKNIPALLFAALPGLRLSADDYGGSGEFVELRRLAP